MKALLDEQLSPQIAALLRGAGYDVGAVVDRLDLIGRSDSQILDIATGEGRSVVTNNIKDFRPLAASRLAQGRIHGGLILVPSARTRTRSASSALTDAIRRVMDDHPDGLESREIWIGPLSNS